MLQKKAPNDLKSLDAELKYAHALRGAAGWARPPQAYGPSLRFCKDGRFHGRAFQRLHSVQAPAVVSASDAALRGGGSAPRNLDQPIAELSAARIAGARNVPFVGSGQSELAARPEGNFSWLQGLEKSRNGERISPSARGRGRPGAPPPRSPARPAPPPAEASAKPLPVLDEERRRRYGASGRPFVPGAARVKAACYFFCDFT
jgi:hypothetical protein